MFRMQAPNIFFDIFEDNNFDDWFVPSKHCGMEWSNGTRRVPCSGVEQSHRPFLHSTSAFHKRSPQTKFEPLVHPLVKSEPNPSTLAIYGIPFKADFDLELFKPSEISVKLDGNTLIVQGKHELTADDHSEHYEYVKKVQFPENVLLNQIKCTLDQRGHLQVIAPLNARQTVQANIENVVPKNVVASESKPQFDELNTQIEPMESDSEVTIEDIGPE